MAEASRLAAQREAASRAAETRRTEAAHREAEIRRAAVHSRAAETRRTEAAHRAAIVRQTEAARRPVAAAPNRVRQQRLPLHAPRTYIVGSTAYHEYYSQRPNNLESQNNSRRRLTSQRPNNSRRTLVSQRPNNPRRRRLPIAPIDYPPIPATRPSHIPPWAFFTDTNALSSESTSENFRNFLEKCINNISGLPQCDQLQNNINHKCCLNYNEIDENNTVNPGLCAICHDTTEDNLFIKFQCGHYFHVACYQKNLNYNKKSAKSCPICRSQIFRGGRNKK